MNGFKFRMDLDLKLQKIQGEKIGESQSNFQK